MPRKHAVNNTVNTYSNMAEIRCVCGALLMTGIIGGISMAAVDAAYDKHIIAILDTQYIKQFTPPSN